LVQVLSLSFVEIAFSSNRLQKMCASERNLRRELGEGGAKKAAAHLASLRAAPSLEEFRSLPGRCHELGADRAGQLALVLPGGKRLIFEPAGNSPPTKADGGLAWAAVRAICVLEIADYHG
jgi:proteic killer suppression protein